LENSRLSYANRASLFIMATSLLRQYGPTVIAGLAIGGAAGMGGSLLADLKHKGEQQQRQEEAQQLLQKAALAQLGATPTSESLAQLGAALGSTSGQTPVKLAPRLNRWDKRWTDDGGSMSTLGWHLTSPHPVLVKHYDALMGSKNDEDQRLVLFPLCGASVDLAHLASRGHHVVGVDGISLALSKLLQGYGEELPSGGGLAPGAMRMRVAQPGPSVVKQAERLSTRARKYTPAPFLFGVEGDFLEFDSAAAGKYGFDQFDCAFDRGGLVAVEPGDRPQYASNLASLLKPGGRILLVTVEHEPKFGPPHSVEEAEVRALFGKAFDIVLLSKEDKLDAEPVWRKRGATEFSEAAYMLTRKRT
jgi:thiopurine S-methyltransferase